MNILLNNKSNKIYLKDLKEVSNKDNNLSYKIYSNHKIEDLEAHESISVATHFTSL